MNAEEIVKRAVTELYHNNYSISGIAYCLGIDESVVMEMLQKL